MCVCVCVCVYGKNTLEMFLWHIYYKDPSSFSYALIFLKNLLEMITYFTVAYSYVSDKFR